MNEIRNIWTLAKSGFLHKEKRSLKATIFLGLKLYGILILMKLISVGLLYLLNLFNIFNMPSNIGGENLRTYNPIIQIIIVAVYVPIVEELAFRIGLKFSKWNFTIASIAMVLSTSRVIFQIEWTYCIIICIVFGIILYLILKDRAVNFLSEFWLNNRRKIFYILLFLFGIGHLGNYEITSELLIFSLIIILPHLSAGFIYSYARLNSGIILAICIHSLNNGLPKIIAMIAE